MTPAEISTALPLSDFRTVTMQYENPPGEYGLQREAHIVHHTQVDTFVAACVRLHHDPGINPANKEQASPIEAVFVSEFKPTGPYWWCMPNLGETKGEIGATLFNADMQWHPYWSSPKYKAKQDASRQAEEDAEMALYD